MNRPYAQGRGVLICAGQLSAAGHTAEADAELATTAAFYRDVGVSR
jgi:hypothetical protein